MIADIAQRPRRPLANKDSGLMDLNQGLLYPPHSLNVKLQ